MTLVRHQLAVWPVAAIELREDEHPLVAYLERSGPWHLLEVRRVFIIVRHKVVIEVVVDVTLGDLVLHDHGVRDAVDDAGSDLLEELDVLGLVVSCVPPVLVAVLAALDYKDII